MEEEIKLASETNLLDPKVVFDPTKLTTTVATTWITNDTSDPEAAENDVNVRPVEDQTKVSGIIYPIIRIDSHVIQRQNIHKLVLYYTDFIPSIDVTIIKYPELVVNTTGMVNKLTVIIIPPVNGTYKKISVDFYITNVMVSGDKVVYSCSYFYPALQKRFTKAIKNSSGTSKINTYDLLHSIASECQLGFAATTQCKEIADTKIRLTRNQSYIDVIKEHINFGGLDDKSFFDAWIDVYGYLVIANVSHIFESKVQSNELSMKELTGVNTTDSTSEMQTIEYSTEDVMRSFTNWKMAGKKTANKIKSYQWIVDNSSIIRNGTDNTFFYFNHLVNDTGSNNIESENIKIEEDSVDGKNFRDAYTFEKKMFIGTEMGSAAEGNTPVLIQEKKRNAFFAKRRSKQLKIELEEVNTFIERGTLINIMIFEFDRTQKQQLLLNTSNASTDGNISTTQTTEIADDENMTTDAILSDDSMGVPNLEVSGIYYVDGIEYRYTSEKLLTQTLFLIKHSGTNNSFLNYSSLPKQKELEQTTEQQS
jgi:hypothetical protein